MEAFADKITIGDKYRPAMEITDPIKAKEYFEMCVEHTMRFGKTREEAESIERQNLGYFSGYYSNDTMVRVQELFCCAHPIFGRAMADTSGPTTEQTLEAGRRAALKAQGREG